MKKIIITATTTTTLITTTSTNTTTTATLDDVVDADSFSLQQVCIMNEHSKYNDIHVEVFS